MLAISGIGATGPQGVKMQEYLEIENLKTSKTVLEGIESGRLRIGTKGHGKK